MTRVAFVENNKEMRNLLEKVLATSPELLLVGSWTTAEDAILNLPKLEVDVVLMDIRLPHRSGIECTRKLKSMLPQLEVLMFTSSSDSKEIFESFRAGASGYLLKSTSPSMLIRGILETAQGGSPLSSSVARRIIQSFKETRLVPPPECEALTEREAEVLQWMSNGLAEKEIASQLHVSLNTIKTHRKRIYQKLDVHSRDCLLRMKA